MSDGVGARRTEMSFREGQSRERETDFPDWVQDNFDAFLDAVPDAVLVVNSAGEIVMANAQAESLFRYPASQLTGTAVELLIPERLRERHPEHVNSFFADPRMRPMGAGLELLGLRADGSEFPVEISLSPLAARAGLFVISVVRDISERKQKDEQIEKLNLELRQRILELAASNQELEAFSYSVSHDLRAPLRQIDGFSKILSEELDQTQRAEVGEYLEQIRDGTRRMGQLVDALLSFSRLGKQEISRQYVDMNTLVQGVIFDLREEIGNRNVEWKVGELLPAQCDPHLMKQAFRNLLSNAVKFTRPRPRAIIEIGQEVSQEQLVFWVRDNGIGFDMRYADKLFGVFQRLHLQEEFEGAGVGLANVQRIVLKHGGRAWAESDPGKGTTVFFSLSTGMEVTKGELSE